MMNRSAHEWSRRTMSKIMAKGQIQKGTRCIDEAAHSIRLRQSSKGRL